MIRSGSDSNNEIDGKNSNSSSSENSLVNSPLSESTIEFNEKFENFSTRNPSLSKNINSKLANGSRSAIILESHTAQNSEQKRKHTIKLNPSLIYKKTKSNNYSNPELVSFESTVSLPDDQNTQILNNESFPKNLNNSLLDCQINNKNNQIQRELATTESYQPTSPSAMVKNIPNTYILQPNSEESQDEIDPVGEKKIDSHGNLLDGREYIIPTFTFPERKNPDMLFVLFSHILKLIGQKDNVYFSQKYPELKKIETTQAERNYLVDQGWLYQTFRFRPSYLVPARKFFRSLGALAVKNGKYVVDDYWESLRIKEGMYTSGEYTDTRNFTLKRFVPSNNLSVSDSSKTPLKQRENPSIIKGPEKDIKSIHLNTFDTENVPNLVDWPPISKFENLRPPSFELYSELINDIFRYSATNKKSTVVNTIVGDMTEIPLSAALKNISKFVSSESFSDPSRQKSADIFYPFSTVANETLSFNRKLTAIRKSTHGVIYEPHTDLIHLPKDSQPGEIIVFSENRDLDFDENSFYCPKLEFETRKALKKYTGISNKKINTGPSHSFNSTKTVSAISPLYVTAPVYNYSFNEDNQSLSRLGNKKFSFFDPTQCNGSLSKHIITSKKRKSFIIKDFKRPISILNGQFQRTQPVHRTRFGISFDQSLSQTKKSLLTSLFSIAPNLIQNFHTDRRANINNPILIGSNDPEQRYNDTFNSKNTNFRLFSDSGNTYSGPYAGKGSYFENSRVSSGNSFYSAKTPNQAVYPPYNPVSNQIVTLPYSSMHIQNQIRLSNFNSHRESFSTETDRNSEKYNQNPYIPSIKKPSHF
ncbi:Chromatin structure-remodeling complex subunit RSC7 [Smittium mucronatum]|uniref:Chromatin structure-remodeling complex subunit RSC7 n=1 Tax=Smittium mucronatum TaxID=133383 RepID=A0A1R0H7X8_9FUNG|nr:Chromatin structure-remodeling complex subunit RSC7 [Smittium mucronatum]